MVASATFGMPPPGINPGPSLRLMAHNQPHQAHQDGPTSNFNDSIEGLAYDDCPNIVIGPQMAWNSPWFGKKASAKLVV